MKKILASLMVSLSFACSTDNASEKTETPAAALIETREADVVGKCAELNQFQRREVYFVIGQSNAGFFATSHAKTKYGDRVLGSSNGVDCVSYKDPFPWANGQGGRGGSIWAAFADDRIERGLTDQIVFVNVAVGGSPVQAWIPGGLWHSMFITKIQEISAAGLSPTGILWVQGESNHEISKVSPLSENDYYSYFTLMVDAMRSHGIQAPFYAGLSTVCGLDSFPSVNVRAAIMRAIETRGMELNIKLGGDTDGIGPEKRDDENCHYNGEGQKAAGLIWSEALSK